MKTPCPEKLSDYLYYLELDGYDFTAVPENDPPLSCGGCSTVRKGSLYGRNLDLGYCETPEFIVRMSAADGRFASIGLCADLSVAGSVSELTAAALRRVPNVTSDGINENGVIVSVNVVVADGVDDMSGTAPGKTPVHATRLVRYLLDRASSAEHAAELMGQIDIVGDFSGYALHWMIADAADTYVVEIIGGKLIFSRNRQYYLTNFYLNLGPELPKQFIGGRCFENLPLLNDYAIGVERYCVLRDGYDGVRTAEDMTALMRSVRATASYDRTNDPLWYSEFCGGEVSIRSEKQVLEKELTRQIGLYEARDRSDPKGDWITWNTSVYDIEARSLTVFSQEDYSTAFRYRLSAD